MARTDRSAAAAQASEPPTSAAAMDELDLDDLFLGDGDGAGGADDLFGGLDELDLGAMDEITDDGPGGGGGGGGSKKKGGGGGGAMDGLDLDLSESLGGGGEGGGRSKSGPNTSRGRPSGSTSPPPTKKSTRKKRKTKKMLASERGDDSDDDDYVPEGAAPAAAAATDAKTSTGRTKRGGGAGGKKGAGRGGSKKRGEKSKGGAHAHAHAAAANASPSVSSVSLASGASGAGGAGGNHRTKGGGQGHSHGHGGRAKSKKSGGHVSSPSLKGGGMSRPLSTSPIMMPPPFPAPSGSRKRRMSGVADGSSSVLPRHLQGSAVFHSSSSGAAAASPDGTHAAGGTPKKQRRRSSHASRPGASAAASAAAAAAAVAASAGPPVDPTYCGLGPSKSQFYPFMPLPAEVVMRRAHRMFPILEKVHQHIAHLSSDGSFVDGGNPPNGGGVGAAAKDADGDALVRLFVDHLGVGKDAAAGASGGTGLPDPSALTSSVQRSLSLGRSFVSQLTRAQLREELQTALDLVRRQAKFMGQSLSNMEVWCRDNMTQEDFHSTYSGDSVGAGALPVDPAPGQTKKGGRRRSTKGGGGAKSSPSSILPPVTSTVPVYVKIRVKCKGFRESATVTARLNGGPLLAQLPVPPAVVRAAAAAAALAGAGGPSAAKKTKKGRGAASAAADALLPPSSSSLSPVRTPPAPPAVQYEHLTPAERRRVVSRAISSRAYDLEGRWRSAMERREAAQRNSLASIGRIIAEDPVEVCHTSTLWEIMEHSPYVANLTEEDVREGLAEAWQPELGTREMHWGEIPPVRIKKAPKKRKERKDDTEGGGGGGSTAKTVLFDRLQSLLVDVGGGDSEDEDATEEEGTSLSRKRRRTGETASIYASDPNAERPLSSEKQDGEAVLDLSKLSLDQRTYVQLRAVGLADVPLLPSVLPVVEEVAESAATEALPDKVRSANAGTGGAAVTASLNDDKWGDDDIDTVVRRMQADLSAMHHANNGRAALLQAAATAHLAEQKRAKRREDEGTLMIAKHAQLLKKQKETNKRVPKPNTSKDADWLPW